MTLFFLFLSKLRNMVDTGQSAQLTVIFTDSTLGDTQHSLSSPSG